MDRDTDTDYNAVLTAAAEKIRVLAEGMTRNQQQLKEALKTLGYGTKD